MVYSLGRTIYEQEQTAESIKCETTTKQVNHKEMKQQEQENKNKKRKNVGEEKHRIIIALKFIIH